MTFFAKESHRFVIDEKALDVAKNATEVAKRLAQLS